MNEHTKNRTEAATEVILDCITEGVFTVDPDFVVTSFNHAAEEITGIPREEAIGLPCCEVFRANICESACALHRSLETGKPVVNKPVVIMTARGREVPIRVSTAILKDPEGRVLGGVETFRDLTQVEELRKELKQRYTFADMISKSRKMHEVFSILPQIAESDSTVLIESESGTGKELLARAIHSLSHRKDGPFIAVNCGALPDALLESELFGYLAGAFTDAKRDKPGRFTLAEGGTIFLDEIGDISPALQVRLLRVLQEREFEPLGAIRPVKADVRVVSASNKNIEELVREGVFRNDLYYRVNVVKVLLPPLRDRKEDIPLLVENFIDRFNRIRGKEIAGMSESALTALMNHDWPGNVRELENVIEHAFILCTAGLIEAKHLPGGFVPPDTGTVRSAGGTLADAEARFIQEVLERNHWKMITTARELGINKTTLWRKLKKHEISPPPRETK